MSSEEDYPTDTEIIASEDSSHTIGNPTVHRFTSNITMSEGNSNEPEHRVLGTSLQKFSKDLVKSLGNFKFSDELTDDNYVSWSQAMSEILQSIDLDPFIKSEEYEDELLTGQENKKTKFIITTYILNHLDSNNNIQARNYLSCPEDPHTIVYSPVKLWTFPRQDHRSEARRRHKSPILVQNPTH